jgi:hypothetical protein
MRAFDALRTQVENIDKDGPLRITTRHNLGELVVPEEVRMEEMGGEVWIRYRLPVSGKARKPQGALAAFLRLADNPISSERFLKFAQQWGVLCICEHKMIASHSLNCFPFCDEPAYSTFQKFLQEEEGLRRVGRKMMFAFEDVWFKEPLSLWVKYASSMRAVVRIFMNLRGELRDNTLDHWNVLRQLDSHPRDNSRISRVEEMERLAGESIHQASFPIQASALGHVLDDWILECNLVPQIGWYFEQINMPIRDLHAQCVLKASYSEVGLFDSHHLPLFSVLVEQCVRALGSRPYFRQCGCIGCDTHVGNCQRLIELKDTPGRPSVYCNVCRPFVRQQQKSGSRKKNKKEKTHMSK